MAAIKMQAHKDGKTDPSAAILSKWRPSANQSEGVEQQVKGDSPANSTGADAYRPTVISILRVTKEKLDT